MKDSQSGTRRSAISRRAGLLQDGNPAPQSVPEAGKQPAAHPTHGQQIDVVGNGGLARELIAFAPEQRGHLIHRGPRIAGQGFEQCEIEALVHVLHLPEDARVSRASEV